LDKLELSSTLRTLSFQRDGEDLVITKDCTTGVVRIRDQFGPGDTQIEALWLLDLTVDLGAMISETGSDAASVFVGTDQGETIGLGGRRDAVFAGSGDDILIGGTGQNDLFGARDPILTGWPLMTWEHNFCLSAS